MKRRIMVRYYYDDEGNKAIQPANIEVMMIKMRVALSSKPFMGVVRPPSKEGPRAYLEAIQKGALKLVVNAGAPNERIILCQKEEPRFFLTTPLYYEE